MNKLVKGAIAAGVGTALLLGGAGTLATWNSSVGVSGAAITAGNLVVTDGPAGTWTVQKDGTGAQLPIADIATFKASPGDKLTFSKDVTITATGDNLVATLGLGAGAIAPATAGDAEDIALAGFLQQSSVFTVTGAGISGTSPTFTVTPGAAGISARPVTVAVTINFPKSGTVAAENAAMNGSVSLAGLTIDLTQQ